MTNFDGTLRITRNMHNILKREWRRMIREQTAMVKELELLNDALDSALALEQHRANLRKHGIP